MINEFLVLALLLFFIGAAGVVWRKNAFVIFMSIEMMLNACALIFAIFSRMHGEMSGQISVLLIIAIAAAEASFGLGLIVLLYKQKRSLNIDTFTLLKDSNAR